MVISRRDLLLSALAFAPTRPLPPLSWTCPMHAEVVTDAAGGCPICKMTLVPVRLESVWSCQLHPETTRFAPGVCPIDRRSLVRMIKALSFGCPAHPNVNQVDPGRCPIDRRPLVAKYELRPHGDHNPKHGGQFLMAPNNWHVEVTHPAPGLFRLYVYDDYSRPFVPKGFAGRITSIADAAGTATETSVAFARAAGRPLLEARVPGLALPATIAVKVRFQVNEQEYRFDFPFVGYSKEPR
ncbi:MAG TPA: heavy metal-binding domain-containing protein [Vicinamibacterales bacterium]|nr:heavy metal-binding domain-containing protein [Vicinamibacterales bacterium]